MNIINYIQKNANFSYKFVKLFGYMILALAVFGFKTLAALCGSSRDCTVTSKLLISSPGLISSSAHIDPTGSSKMSKEISLATVKEHNKPDDLWVIIEKKVYNVTKFLHEHPGGEDSLIDVAGRDGTKEFIDVGHSQEAREIMKKYYIGDLAASDCKKKCPVSCRDIGLAVGAVLVGITLVYVLRRGLVKN